MNLYNDEFIKYVRASANNSLWYIRSAIRAEVSKSVVYNVDVVLGLDGSITEYVSV